MFNYLICLDFEATCWQHDFNRNEMEIIEIAAILLNLETGVKESQFHCYVRPTRHPKLSNFCKKLTGIKQELIDTKRPFSLVYHNFIKWLDRIRNNFGLHYTSLAGMHAADGPNTSFCSWSNMDLNFFFRNECERNGITCPSYLKAWIDMQMRFEILHGSYRPRKFSDALKCAKISPVGRAHSGLSDATNLANLVMYSVNHGLIFTTASEYYH